VPAIPLLPDRPDARLSFKIRDLNQLGIEAPTNFGDAADLDLCGSWRAATNRTRSMHRTDSVRESVYGRRAI
jgi:hypothetical protein